jgi:probable rRNA maturation factor
MEPIFINQSSMDIPEAQLSEWVSFVIDELGQRKVWPQRALQMHEQPPEELVIVFVDEERGRELNLQFRKKDYATDVLSFTSQDPCCLGELVLCPQVLQRQAEENQHSFADESRYLVLHGILHLLGYEHEDGGAAAKEMYSLQDAIFAKIDKFK